VLHCATPSGAGSFKSQMKKADGSGAAFAVIIGDDEIANATAAVKPLREQGAEQANVPFDSVVDYLVDEITGNGGGHDHGDHSNCTHH
jgi:histidyl-tRNA synthetase